MLRHVLAQESSHKQCSRRTIYAAEQMYNSLFFNILHTVDFVDFSAVTSSLNVLLDLWTACRSALSDSCGGSHCYHIVMTLELQPPLTDTVIFLLEIHETVCQLSNANNSTFLRHKSDKLLKASTWWVEQGTALFGGKQLIGFRLLLMCFSVPGLKGRYMRPIWRMRTSRHPSTWGPYSILYGSRFSRIFLQVCVNNYYQNMSCVTQTWRLRNMQHGLYSKVNNNCLLLLIEQIQERIGNNVWILLG